MRNFPSFFYVLFEEVDRNIWSFHPGNLRFLRKILEIPDSGRALVAVREEYATLIAGIKKVSNTEGIQIKFSGYMAWGLIKNGIELIHYEGGRYSFPAMGNGDEEYSKKLIFPNSSNNKIVRRTIEILKKQRHGTSVVFVDTLVIEKVLCRLVRLNRAYRIRPIAVCELEENTEIESLMIGLSSIDGALIAGYDGKIYAVGVILDGEAIVRADVARGARFNSLQNFVNWMVYQKVCKKEECFAAIISEDETVNVETADDDKWLIEKGANNSLYMES